MHIDTCPLKCSLSEVNWMPHGIYSKDASYEVLLALLSALYNLFWSYIVDSFSTNDCVNCSLYLSLALDDCYTAIQATCM